MEFLSSFIRRHFAGNQCWRAPWNFGCFLWLISSSFLFKLYPALRFYFTRVIALWLWIRKCLLTVLRTGCSVWWINTEIWSPYVLLQFVTKTANTFNEKYQNVVRKKKWHSKRFSRPSLVQSRIIAQTFSNLRVLGSDDTWWQLLKNFFQFSHFQVAQSSLWTFFFRVNNPANLWGRHWLNYLTNIFKTARHVGQGRENKLHVKSQSMCLLRYCDRSWATANRSARSIHHIF